jgi:hypothetical protein
MTVLRLEACRRILSALRCCPGRCAAAVGWVEIQVLQTG